MSNELDLPGSDFNCFITGPAFPWSLFPPPWPSNFLWTKATGILILRLTAFSGFLAFRPWGFSSCENEVLTSSNPSFRPEGQFSLA